MSDFMQAYSRTMGHEGGYANNPNDKGGETYKGISRKNWGAWPGWRVIDNAKDGLVKQPLYGTSAYQAWVKYFNGLLNDRPNLQASVAEFYRANFWGKLDGVNDQRIAEEVFDKHVNCGRVALFWIQRAAGCADDGIIGSGTITAINKCEPVALLERFNEQAKHYYDNIMQRDPSQRVFRKSWYSRLRDYNNKPYVKEQ